MYIITNETNDNAFYPIKKMPASIPEQYNHLGIPIGLVYFHEKRINDVPIERESFHSEIPEELYDQLFKLYKKDNSRKQKYTRKRGKGKNT
jgi:hypothetical protein